MPQLFYKCKNNRISFYIHIHLQLFFGVESEKYSRFRQEYNLQKGWEWEYAKTHFEKVFFFSLDTVTPAETKYFTILSECVPLSSHYYTGLSVYLFTCTVYPCI